MTLSREDGLKEIYLLVRLTNEGVNIDPNLFKDLDYDETYKEQVRRLFDWNFDTYIDSKIPAGFRLKSSGKYSPIFWNPKAKLSITLNNEKYYLTGNQEVIQEITFEHKAKAYNLKTSDGKDISRIIDLNDRGRVGICYSNECSLKDKGLDCLFCNINATKDTFGELDGIEWKNPKQIAESVSAAYKEGYKGFNLTGGFVPERREVEYYIDVIEAIKEESGLEDEEVHGMACIGAPSDLSVIEKYKEAGYQHIATNLEIWDENLFKTICPGKEELCGGRQNWINALKHEVEVFGKGNVRSCLVSGIEPKESILEGIEYLASIGVIAIPQIWRPCIGSAFEGHTSPTSEWHFEVLERTYNIYKKYGFTLEQFYYVFDRDNIYAYFFELDSQTVSWEEKKITI